MEQWRHLEVEAGAFLAVQAGHDGGREMMLEMQRSPESVSGTGGRRDSPGCEEEGRGHGGLWS